MQRYYFEIKIDDMLIADDRGRDCRDLAEAHAHATKVVADCVRFCPPEPTGGRGRIAIVDDMGRRCLTVLFPANDRLPKRAASRIKRRASQQISRRVEGRAGL